MDESRQQTRGRAIISDDDEFFRIAFRSLLIEHNRFSDVIATASFEEDVDRLGTVGPVEIGFFDLNMVGMENWLDLSAVRAEYPGMRLVVVSASRSAEDVLNSLAIGAHGFVNKGLGIGELSHAVDLICGGQVYVPPFLPDDAMKRTPIEFSITADSSDEESLAAPSREALRCSPRQREIIELLIEGRSNKHMARKLSLSEGTIKFHMSAVLRLLGASNRVEAATSAMKLLAR